MTSKKGLAAALFSGAKGTLIVGDGAVALADNSWFMIDAKATTSELPFDVGYLFKTPDTANAITPAVGDNVYPIDMTLMCRADATYSSENGTFEDTDDCSNGVVTMKKDGFTTHSGSINAFIKFNTDGTLGSSVQSGILGQFFDIQSDDGAGTYSLTSKTDDPILLAILSDKDDTTVANTQVWKLMWVNITSLTSDTPLKGAQVLNSSWQVSEGPVSIYKRVTNAAEDLF